MTTRNPQGETDEHAPHALSRRKVLAGTAIAAAAWTTPTVLRFERAAAAVGSCADTVVSWTSGFISGGAYTINGSNAGITIQAIIRAFLSPGASPQVFLSAGRIVLAMSNHQISDRWTIDLTFTTSTGTICTASTTILDVDQNGRGLSCPTNSRFRDEINSIYGTGASPTPQGSLIENPPGTWAPTTPCKTTNLDNLTLTWTNPAGVSTGGFTWQAGTPPGNSLGPDRQIILITPVTLCTTQPPSPAGASLAAAPALERIDNGEPLPTTVQPDTD